MIVHIREIVASEIALSSEKGKAVREYYGEGWRNESLEFDFADIVRVSPSFLSQALLPLLLELSPEQLRQKVSFVNKPSTFDYVWENILKAVEERVRRAFG